MSQYFDPQERAKELQDFREFLQPLKGHKGQLMQALHHAQDGYGFIPPEVQQLISAELNIPLADVYGVITFYSRFSEIPKGKTQISVCMGTACYVKGAVKVLNELESVIGVKPGNTTADGMVSLSTTRCLGACSMAPVMTIGEEVHGRLLPKDVANLLVHLEFDNDARMEAEAFLAGEEERS